MWHRVDIVLTEVSEEHLLTLLPRWWIFFFSTLKMEAVRSSETSVNTISTRGHTLEDCFLHSHRRENLKFYIHYFCFPRKLQEFGERSVLTKGCILFFSANFMRNIFHYNKYL
jgi:hypothetical protein